MKHRILLVDDNPTSLKFLKAAYEPEGYEIITAPDGLEALEILFQEKIDLVISDVLMPNIDGYLLCYKIRNNQRLKHIPVIIYTATYISTKEENSAREMGANLFLRKPTPVKLLVSSVNDILKHPEKYPARIPLSRQASALMQNYNEELVARLEQNNIHLKETKLQIEQNEARLKQAQAISHVGSWELDLATGIGVWSEEACRIYGLPLDDNKQSYDRWVAFIHPDDRDHVLKLNSDAEKILGGTFIDHRIILGDGTIKHIHSESKYEVDDEGRPIALYGVCQDVTEHKIAEQLKEFDQKNLFALINNTHDLIWSVDRDLKLISFNHPFVVAVTALTGKSVEKGTDVLALSFGDELTRWKQFYARALSGETFTEVEYSDTPSESWREVSFYPIRKEDVVVGTACYAHDITEQKRFETLIRNNEKITRLILDSSLDAIVVMNINEEVILWNPQAEKIFGWTQEEILGKKLSEIIIPEHLREAHREIFKNYKLTGNRSFLNKRSEVTALTKDHREIPIEQTIVPIMQGDSEFFCSFIKDISRTKEAAEKLAQSEKRFRALIENISDGIVLNDENSNLLYQSPSVERILGYTWEERKGKQTLHYVHPDDRAGFVDFYEKLKSTPEKPIHFQYRFLHKKGYYVWLEGVVTNLLHEASVRAVVANYRDITERKNAEERLISERALLRTMIDNLPDYIYVKDLESRHLINNKAMVSLMGANTEEETLGKTSADFFGQAVARPYLDEDRMILTTGISVINSEETTISSTAGLKYLLTTKVPLRDNDNKIIGLVGISRDITQNKQIELDLREKKYFLEKAQEVGHIGHWISELGHNAKLVWSEEVCRIFGIPVEEFDQKLETFFNHVHPEDLDAVSNSTHDAITNHAPYSLDHRIVLKDGTIKWVHEQGEATYDENNNATLLVGIVQDITSRKHAEQEILKLNSELEERVMQRTEQLQAANKEMEAFTYSVSHDLRAPLRIIDGYSQMLIEDYAAKLDEEANETLKVIMSNAKKMGQLIDDLLNLSRMNKAEIRKSRVDMNDLVKDVLFELQQSGVAVPEKLQIMKLKEASCDANLVRHVWSNLLSNAIKYPSGKDSPEIEVGMSVAEHKGAVYYVKDNGAGFDMKYYHKLFGVFQRLHNHDEFSGTGVGLAIVHRIVLRHGGTVWGEATPNGGATFFFNID